MTNQEVNERIAEFMGIDVKAIKANHGHVWVEDKGERHCSWCQTKFQDCKDKSEYCWGYSSSLGDLPDYCSNAMPVLEKLAHELGLDISVGCIGGIGKKKSYRCIMTESTISHKPYYGFGDTIGEAICECAAEYLNAQEGSK